MFEKLKMGRWPKAEIFGVGNLGFCTQEMERQAEEFALYHKFKILVVFGLLNFYWIFTNLYNISIQFRNEML